MTRSASDPVPQALRQLLGASQILSCDQLPIAVQRNVQQVLAGESLAFFPPMACPNSQAQLGELMQWANRDQRKVLILGGGSKMQWGNVIQSPDVILSTQSLNRIIDHALGDLTVTVEAGISFAALQTQLQQTGQMIALDPTYPETATIGGILATRDAGSLRQRYGSVRDMCLGLSFIRADGQWAKAGGRVVKNVAGYDLMKLFTGSYGTLGILSQVTLRLYPIQEASRTVLFLGKDEAIATLTHQLLDSTLTPVAIDLLSTELLSSLGFDAPQGLAVRFQSLPESVVAQVDRIKTLGSELKMIETETDTELWAQLRTTLWTQALTQAETGAIAKFGILPAQASGFLETLTHWARGLGLSSVALCHAGYGLGVVRLKGADEIALLKLLNKLRSRCEQHQGFLTILEAPQSVKQALDVWGYSGNAWGVMKQLKSQFDPKDLLNPGRFVGGL